MLISVVVPLHNEQDNVSLLYDRLVGVFGKISHLEAEFVLIDDGSRDRTWDIIKLLSEKNKNVKGVRLSRNFGQQNALTAGLQYAHGEAVIMMDGDLQHPPELIPQMVNKWQEGYDIVYTKRERNESYGFLKNSFSKVFAFIFNRLSTVEVAEGVLDFRLLSRQVVEEIKGLKERCRFLRGLVSWVGFKSCFISYQAPKRLAGQTKYSLWKSLSLAMTGILSFSPKPLYVASFLGMIATSISALYIIYAIYVKFFTNFTVPGWTSILISVLFLGGIQLLAIGILGSYLGMVYEEVKGRPSYIVHQTTGL